MVKRKAETAPQVNAIIAVKAVYLKVTLEI